MLLGKFYLILKILLGSWPLKIQPSDEVETHKIGKTKYPKRGGKSEVSNSCIQSLHSNKTLTPGLTSS